MLTMSCYVNANDLDILLAMSLEDLSNTDISVTSAAKKPQNIEDIPAAVYVITNEQIRRSGVRSVAEALALAPGVQVTRISEFNWQVSLRSLNEVLFNKLLVMIDGRSVYSPLMSGTFWHTIDALFQDIDRIEVIRGTAGTMWGGNAANGVVNIITKSSTDTQGHYAEVAAGEKDYQEFNYRYGFSLDDNTTARFYMKGVTSDYYLVNDDSWRNLSGGFRADHNVDNRNISVQAGGYQTRSQHYWFYGNFYLPPEDVFTNTTLNVFARGAYASFDWIEQYNDKTTYELHLWADANSTNEPSAQGEFYTLDLDTLAHHALSEKHQLTAGGGVRVIHRRTESYPDDFYSHVEPWGRYSHDPIGTDFIVNGYGQIESQLNDQWFSTIGAKIEYFSLNDSVEFQPQARFLYRHNDQQQFWFGAGRAAVTPSFVESKTDSYILGTVGITDGNGNIIDSRPTVVYTVNNQNLKNETVRTIDAGYRYSPTHSLSIDNTIFYSKYKNLRMEGDRAWACVYGECIDGSTLPYEIFTLINTFSDGLNADSYGFETAIQWQPLSALKLNTSYSYMKTNAECSGSAGCDANATSGYRLMYDHQPAHFASIQSLWQITPAWQLDLWLKYKSKVEADVPAFSAPSITTLDVRLAWQQKPCWPRIEWIIDGIGKDPYEDLPGKSLIEETFFMRAAWDLP
ncbi:TonB-dependent receptor plug domain-containing protein [Photobacterium aquae]|nr:TonB-dependent receptor plug domain-containing protein [Photobacterium aquae]